MDGRVFQNLFPRVLRKVTRGPQPRRAAASSPLGEALEELLVTRKSLSIVQVGANDGRLNDPIHPFIQRHPDQTRLLLIEPQASVLPMLRETYADHPSATILQCAIGSPGISTLWTIKQSCWEDFHPGYAVLWPSYRAPTGLTSENRSHVESLVAKHYGGELPLDAVLDSFQIESRSLLDVLESSGFGFGVDLLQVDTEGSDDVVIMNSAIEQLRPALINFESAHLSEPRMTAVCEHLITIGYKISDNGRDALAVLKSQ